jgi:putative phosphoribosyl transferase
MAQDGAFTGGVLFRDRRAAGARLGDRLAACSGREALVLAIPRGGVPVAAEVARRLDAELDVVVARKLGAPGQPELAIGAVTADGGRLLNEQIDWEGWAGRAYLARVTAEQMAEARRREERLRGGAAPPRIAGRTVILVDDGLATGATVRAAVRSVRRHGPARLIVAVPVGSTMACEALRAEADEVVCLHEREDLVAVGRLYADFRPTGDAEVEGILRAARARAGAVAARPGEAEGPG